MAASFKQLVRRVQTAEKHVENAKADLNMFVDQLREICPHLTIAVCEIGGRHTRVCQHCGIQEVQWPSAFTTLTAPGGTWYETEHDKSKERRKGQAPVIFPMEVHLAFRYRRGTHLDVTEG